MGKKYKEPEVIPFENQTAWIEWLAKNHKRQEGIWLHFFKKNSGAPTVTYDEALDGALCYGWIDGQVKNFDHKSYLQKFTPRRMKSLWSKRNRQRAEHLIESGQMRQPGLKEIEMANIDGRWNAAYDRPSEMSMPEDFMQVLGKKPKVKAFFETLSKANTYAIAWRLQTAKKPETRQKRFDELLAMLERGEKLH